MYDRLALPIPARPARSTSPVPPAVPPPGGPETGRGASFRETLRNAAREMAAREAVLDRALRRGVPSASPEQLLALQATVHRHAQEVELAAKLVDKLTGAVRQVLTSQQ